MKRTCLSLIFLVIEVLALVHAEPVGKFFLPTPAADIQAGTQPSRQPGTYSRRFNPAALTMKPGEELELALPDGNKHLIVFDRAESHTNGDVTWIGHIKGDSAPDHRVFVTVGKASISGRISTPGGSFLLKSENGQQWLVDPVSAGHKEAPIDDRSPKIPQKPVSHRPGASANIPMVAAAGPVGNQTTIDVAVLYSPSLVARLGSVVAVQTRINSLLAVANQAYLDSGVAMTLRLVHSEQVDYPDGKDIDSALNALSASENTYLSSFSDPAMAGVKKMRDLYGADLVSFIRPFRRAVDAACGLAWLNALDGDAINMAGYGSTGYSVVNDGTDLDGSGYYCSDYSFVHELGHNMGSAHELANAGGVKGAYPYSYGYGSSGLFGTIMSYIFPQVGKFSSPLLFCNGSPCGLTGQADNVLSLNNVRAAVSGFRATAPTPITVTPQSGWWWNASEPGRGYFVEVKAGRHFTASFLYDNTGYPVWYVTGPASVLGNSLTGILGTYHGGQTLTGAYVYPTGPVSAGNMTLTFSDSTHGTIVWPGGSVPITRYELAAGSLSLPDPAFKPETGWWYNSSEGGRGFSIEVQGDNLYIAGFMYDGSGNPIWYVSGGKMSSNTYYQGNWQQCANGQALTGSFRMATCSNLANGAIAINFSSTSTATMLLPGGRQLSLTRYPF